jgi:hypothetical protein
MALNSYHMEMKSPSIMVGIL